MVMQQAEVPERLAGDRQFGPTFVYESQLLGRRLGAVLVQQLDQLQALPGALQRRGVCESVFSVGIWSEGPPTLARGRHAGCNLLQLDG